MTLCVPPVFDRHETPRTDTFMAVAGKGGPRLRDQGLSTLTRELRTREERKTAGTLPRPDPSLEGVLFMRNTELPSIIQSVGLACVPVPHMPPGEVALARQPVAAAVITLQERSDGRREIISATMSDARDMEFPLTWLIDQALVAGAPTIISPDDRAVLALDAMTRRFWAEPGLAAVCDGVNAIDPCNMPGCLIGDEAALCRRLNIPNAQITDPEIARIWNRHAPEHAIDIALGIAASRLMLWAHGAAFAFAEPDAFFETLLPLRDWMMREEKDWPSLHRAGRSRPVARATSFASTYRAYRTARDGGGEQVRMVTFEDGLFHT